MQRNVIFGSEFILYDIDQRPIAYSKNTALTLKNNLIDVTNKDSKGWAEQISGSRDFNISFEGLVSHNSEFGLDYFTDKMMNGEPFFIKLGVVQNNFEYSYWGEVAIKSIDINAEFDGVVSYEGKLKGVGELTFTNEGSPLQSGYLKVEDDPIFRGSAAFNITNQNKSNWNNAFDKTLQSIEFITSNNVTTLFTTLRDGSKYSSAFSNAGSGGSGEITALSFNTNNGNLKVNNLTTSLDGRYQTIGDYISNTFLSSNYYSKIQSDDRFYLKTNPDVYLNKVTADGLYSSTGHTHTFSSLISKPTTIIGYGITDAYTKIQSDERYIQSEIDTLDSILGRGNSSSKNVYLSGDTYISKQLSIPTVVPSTVVTGKHYIYSTDIYGGTGSTTGGGGVSFYKDLADVSLFNVANGQSPVWNSTIQKWENKNVSVDLTGYALKDGSNSTGTWGINISGVAKYWGTGNELVNDYITSINGAMIAFGADSKWHYVSSLTVANSVRDFANGAWNINIGGNSATTSRLNGTALLTNNNNFDAIPFSFVGKNSSSDDNLYTYSVNGVKTGLGIGNGSTLNNSISGSATQWNGTSNNFSAPQDANFGYFLGLSAGTARTYSTSYIQNLLNINSGGETLASVLSRGNTGANTQVLALRATDPANGYIELKNTLNSNGSAFRLVSGVWALSQDGFSIYNNNNGTNFHIAESGNIGIGYSIDQGYRLAINGSGMFNGPAGSDVLTLKKTGSNPSINFTGSISNTIIEAGNDYRVYVNGQVRQSIFTNGNTGIGYGIDQGYKFAVDGTSLFSGGMVINGGTTINAVLSVNSTGAFTGDVTSPSFRAINWFRSTGNTGWYNETYGGGIYMSDTTWVRVYNGKSLWVDGMVTATKIKATQNLAIPTAPPISPEAGTHYIYSTN